MSEITTLAQAFHTVACLAQDAFVMHKAAQKYQRDSYYYTDAVRAAEVYEQHFAKACELMKEILQEVETRNAHK